MRALSLTVVLLAWAAPAVAQSGWAEGRFYEQRGSNSVTCGTPYSVFEGYDYWGYPYYGSYQTCRRMEWVSWYGTQYGYRWAWTRYGYGWVSFNDTRTWWSYRWYDFTRRA